MNFVQLLMRAPVPQPPIPVIHKKTERGARPGVDNPMHQKCIGRYRLFLENKILTTPELAARMGAASPSSIAKTLHRLEDMGLVKCLGEGKRTRGQGKPPLLWTWINKPANKE